MRRVDAFRLALVAGMLSTLLGCGERTYRVSGKVHFPDGTPLRQGRVVVDISPALGAWGPINDDGTFVLGMKSVEDGLPAGSYKAYILNAETTLPPGFTGNFQPKPLINAKYTSAATSGLTFEVPAQSEWDIKVEKP
jgi:hypothetical protein